MHECTPYGHLTVDGKAASDAAAARLCHVELREYKKLLAELEAAGVPSRTFDGILYSRRMVKDEHLRNVRAEAGKLGGNPKLLNGKDKHSDDDLLVDKDKQVPTPSSSSSSSSSVVELHGRGEAVDNSQPHPSDKSEKAKGTPPAKAVRPKWWRSDQGIDAKAREMGMKSKTGESYEALKDRIFAQINHGKAESA